MTSPMSSLKKSKKNPLPGIGLRSGRNIPFRTNGPAYSEDENKLLAEITNKMAEEKINDLRNNSKMINPFHGGVPPEFDDRATPRSTDTPIKQVNPSDDQLLGLMMTRLSHLEQKLQYQAREMAEKDKKIRILEDKVSILQKAKDPVAHNNEDHQNLQKKCLLLQQQIKDMEAFLADYGMMWVGDTDDPESNVYHDESLEFVPSSTIQEGLWLPESSTPEWKEFEVDFDLVIHNVHELNALAGEGIAQIQKTPGGAKLKIQDPISLILYANGILMFNGPFRPMSDATTQNCLKDLMDGYFPSELQIKYPEGVPINVTDKRNVQFQSKHIEAFKGSGQLLGGETKPSRLVPSNLKDMSLVSVTNSSPNFQNIKRENKGTVMSENENGEAHLEVESDLPGPKLTMEQFLNRLPQSVVKEGKVIDIRNSLSDTFKGSNSSHMNHVSIIETQAVKDMQKRLEISHEKRPPSSKDITTLRVKSENGDHTYILKMKFNDTIGDVRSYIKSHRPQNVNEFYIMSAFPKRSYEDDDVTLQEYGLVPNAALHLKPVTK